MTGEVYDPIKAQEARRLFGFAVNHRPLQLFKDLGSPLPSRVVSSATVTIRHEAQKIFSPDEVSEEDYELLGCGMKDTQEVMHPYLETIVEQSGMHAALEFASHPGTIHTLAVVALRTEGVMHELLNSHIYRRGAPLFKVTADPQALEVTPTFPKPHNKFGCPFAGNNGEVSIDPLFSHFVQWTGQLCVASIAHKQNIIE